MVCHRYCLDMHFLLGKSTNVSQRESTSTSSSSSTSTNMNQAQPQPTSTFATKVNQRQPTTTNHLECWMNPPIELVGWTRRQHHRAVKPKLLQRMVGRQLGNLAHKSWLGDPDGPSYAHGYSGSQNVCFSPRFVRDGLSLDKHILQRGQPAVLMVLNMIDHD